MCSSLDSSHHGAKYATTAAAPPPAKKLRTFRRSDGGLERSGDRAAVGGIVRDGRAWWIRIPEHIHPTRPGPIPVHGEAIEVGADGSERLLDCT